LGIIKNPIPIKNKSLNLIQFNSKLINWRAKNTPNLSKNRFCMVHGKLISIGNIPWFFDECKGQKKDRQMWRSFLI
jgi:hypothetical protein